MENFKKLIDVLKTLKIKNDKQSITGIKELEKYDELIKSVFNGNEITYINEPHAIIDNNGKVVDVIDYGRSLATMTYKIKNTEVLRDVFKQNHLFIYDIINNVTNVGDDAIFLRLIQMNFSKIKKTFTISENIFDEFAEIADRLAINKSKFVENKIVEFINKNK